MTVAALLRLAWRDSRMARRRLALYMSSIAFGVAALVAIDSFAKNVTGSLRDQSRTLLGGDLALQSGSAMPPLVDSLLDSLATTGIQSARLTTFATMALAEPSGGVRLVQVRAASDGYPFYGEIGTEPAGLWADVHGEKPMAFVDPSLLLALDAAVGDSIRLGNQFFEIRGELGDVPGDAGVVAVIGPRVYISERWLPATGLLQFGSRAEYEAIIKLPAEASDARHAERLARSLLWRVDLRSAARRELAARERTTRNNSPRGTADDEAGEDTPSAIASSALRDTLVASEAREAAAEPGAQPAPRIRVRTVEDTERDFTDAVGELARFLGIIGLTALLLGGVGVASGVNAFVASRIDTVAILRCLGATTRQVLTIYVIQSGLMGLAGAIAGAALGVAVQFLLPLALSDFLPVNITIKPEPIPILLGIGTGLWVALVFALRPLLALRTISPLQAIRRDADSTVLRSEWKDLPRLLVDGLLLGSIIAIAVSRIGNLTEGAAVSAGIIGAVAVLYAAATLLIRGARVTVRASWPLALRQGVANLYRPANQTHAVTLALGFGAFLLSTVYLVQSNLLGRVQATAAVSAGNLLFFDVQDDQIDGLQQLVTEENQEIVQSTPIITMRVAAINGRPVAAIIADSSVRRETWTLRREYRSTYRDSVVASEKIVAGKWFADSATRQAARGENPGLPYGISMDQGIADDMNVALGDTITWNVQGVPVRTVVQSLRTVNWARFEANFFVVFEPEAIRRAPKQHVLVANVPDATILATLQRDVVRRYPNISSLDLSLIRQTVADIVSRVVLAVRFLGLFAFLMGVPVLFSAVAATRQARLREGVLLRTLGATRAQVVRILLAEYGALGTLGALTGIGLALAASWAITRWLFRNPFEPALLPLSAIALAIVGLTMTIGFLTSRDAYRATPMAAIRDSQ